MGVWVQMVLVRRLCRDAFRHCRAFTRDDQTMLGGQPFITLESFKIRQGIGVAPLRSCMFRKSNGRSA